MNIGDFAMYGSCKVRISSVKLSGIASPHYRFSCVETEDHDHTEGWGNLISYRLVSELNKERSLS